MYYALDEPSKWEHRKVHNEYPKASGSFAQVFRSLMSTMLGDRPPNISVVIELKKGFDCYQSIRDNQSDITPLPIGYPIKDFNRVKPIQVLFETPLSILSTYKVDEKSSIIIYADILKNSLKSFDLTVWSVVVIVLFIFVGLLILRRLLNSLKEDTKQGNDLADSPFFETFSHLIGQESSNFLDRPGRLISLIITLGCFLILVFYLNLMSTDLVVETKPSVIRNYRDIMDKKDDYTVGFLAGMSDVKEFEEAEPGSVQDEFRTRMKNSVSIIDIGKDTTSAMTFGINILKQKGVLVSSMFITLLREMTCKGKNSFEDGMPDLSGVYSWVSSDPQGKQKTQGLIMRQGLTTPLITKGLRRTRRLFEADIVKTAIARGISNVDGGPMYSGKTDYYSILKCMSDTVNYNSVKVEKVNTENFKYLHLLFVIMLIFAFIVFILEIYVKNRPITVTVL